MATPKIKLYRLFPGYSSQNDNDIQEATNDQLLPVTLKNIMPTNAYTLVGVGKKSLQALIPVINYVQQKACGQVTTDGLFTIPFDNDMAHLIMANRTNIMPMFYYIGTDGMKKNYFTPGVDYIYLRGNDPDLSQISSNTQLKFVLYFNQLETKWYVRFLLNQSPPATLYVENIFQTVLHRVDIDNLEFNDINSTYYLSKNNQSVSSPHEHIPVVGTYANYHLRPKISFTISAQQVMNEDQFESYCDELNIVYSDGSDSSTSNSSDISSSLTDELFYKTVTLTQEDGSFVIDQHYRLSQINNNNINVQFGNNIYSLTAGIVYQKECTLTYYKIPKLSQLLTEDGTEVILGNTSSTKIESDFLLFASQQQDVYSGTTNAKKPNTLYLEYVRSAPLVTTNGDQNYNITKDSLSGTIEYSLNIYDDYCRGIILKESADVDIDDVGAKFRGVCNYNSNGAYIQQNYTNKNNLLFPDSQYLLDVDRGLYYFRKYDVITQTYQKTIFDKDFCNTNDYFFSTYYYRTDIAKTFVSDYQSWVTQHLRNNPDIFYGKQDYDGDDYIDANENSIKVGYIPRYIQRDNGYSILYRNGAVEFASNVQDLDYLGTTQEGQVSTNESTGLMSGGVARANFAYYNGLQNVLDQKLQYDSSYTGGGYKYRALTDKKYPDSIGRRWVKRQNPLQFIGASFITQKLNDSGELTTYNLPDLQTTQLERLSRYGFAKCIIHKDENSKVDYSTTQKIFLDYFITTNNFSYPFAFKISNYIRYTAGRPLYVTTMDEKQIKQRHPELMGTNVLSVFDNVNAEDKFQENKIIFSTLQGDQLDHINVKFSQISILPALKITVPVLTDKIDAFTSSVCIMKNGQFEYDGFQICSLSENNQIITECNIEEVVINGNLIQFDIPTEYRTKDVFVRYRVTTKLYRSQEQYDGELQYSGVYDQIAEDNSGDSSGSIGNMFCIGQNYKVFKPNNSEFVFSVSNINQTTYFVLKVIDFYSVENTYASSIVYTIKKYDL